MKYVVTHIIYTQFILSTIINITKRVIYFVLKLPQYLFALCYLIVIVLLSYLAIIREKNIPSKKHAKCESDSSTNRYRYFVFSRYYFVVTAAVAKVHHLKKLSSYCKQATKAG